MLDFISFYLFGILVIACFSVVVLSSNVLYAMSALASGMIFIAGIFFTLGAEFLGVVQISVYTGAVMALYAFGMMFFDNAKEVSENNSSARLVGILAFSISLVLVAIISLPRVLLQYSAPQNMENNNIEGVENIANLGNVEQIGLELFSKYLLPFEIAALMLLIALIAGIVLALKKKDSSNIIDKDSADSIDSIESIESSDFFTYAESQNLADSADFSQSLKKDSL